MECKKIDLYEYFGLTRPENGKGYLEYCLHSRSAYYPDRIHPAIIGCAGGGYTGICEREGEPVVSAYFGKGYNIFVMEYSVIPHSYPVQLIEGAMAVAYVRLNAEKLDIDPEHIAVMGFSAGGHFTGMLAVMSGEKEVKEALGKYAEFARPSAVIMGYPVISAGEYAHGGSMDNISGNNAELKQKLSLETRVTENSSPAFIWTTANDDLVPSENSLLMAAAYKKNGVPFELHVYENGHHGLGLATEETATPGGRVLDSKVEDYVQPAVATWFEMSCTWLKNRGFRSKDVPRK